MVIVVISGKDGHPVGPIIDQELYLMMKAAVDERLEDEFMNHGKPTGIDYIFDEMHLVKEERVQKAQSYKRKNQKHPAFK